MGGPTAAVEGPGREKLQLSREEGLALAPIHVEGVYCDHLRRRFEAEIDQLRSDLAEATHRVERIERWLEALRADARGVSLRQHELSQLLRSIKERLLRHRGLDDDADSYAVEVTPNGTITHLAREG